ncbi:hypothetical protein PFISCL1PPCAC_19406 [Pristionchus fissidentatus]|uniref:dTCF n=1 Tax=Pristionchus fissidentatus TaxID=1538716 RepID=A0AAV5WBL5_9BILA|nr:hypothetical protein PFISCL1PPCAC_19406 [Pristionchus fissidentatus]
MADETDEVKVFRVHDEDESDAPSLADDKKDVAMEEEMESKPFFGGEGAAFKPATASSPSFANIFPYQSASPFYGGVNPFQYALMNQAAAATLAAHQYIRNLSPCFNVPLPASPLDMYRNAAALMAAVSPSSGPKMGMMGVPLPPSHRPNPLNQIQMMGGHLSALGGASTSTSSSHHAPKRIKKVKEEHIKKPMNAFMWYMKENRPKIMEEEEWKDKQSAELNKELGFRWQKLGKEEQKKYYEMANEDKKAHLLRYPNWSARENYASNKKKKKKRDRTIESGESKKCRARFGMNAIDKWCKHCTRKKKCLYTRGDDEGGRTSGQSADHGASDSESDLDDDPTTLSVRDLDDNGVKMEVIDTPDFNSFMRRQ